MKITLGASKPSKFKIGAEAIMWWEDTNVSHVYVKIEVLTGRSIVFQAVGSGTEFCSLEYFLSHNIPMYEKQLDVTKENFEKVLTKAISLLKCKYSIKHLAGLFYKRSVQYTTKKIIKNPFKDAGKSAVCVEVLCAIVDTAEIVRQAEDPEDMGMFEALLMLKSIQGKELL